MPAMKGLLEEGKEAVTRKRKRPLGMLRSSPRRSGWNITEMAGYGCVRTFARLLGEDEAAERPARDAE